MIDKDNIPRHVAIIMDGNGRWARERRLPRTAGHHEGVKRVREIVRAADKLGIKVLTLFSFSSENWSRPKKEISTLMRYLNNFLKKEVRDLHKNNIRLKVIGRDAPLSEDIQEKIREAEKLTEDNSGLILVLALNYGSRQEIVDAVKKVITSVREGKADIASLDIEEFSRYLYTASLPDPDLLIRTSGEMRISNFLLWQLSYAELCFIKKYWPDFKEQDLRNAIEEFQERVRRFGGLSCSGRG